ncbi:lamin tail domain-containing protein [Nonomuraea sp. NPDC052634]|uniref:lamin tail domain-containing protein n=1 Tax=Nonomuraea sp. NPDC052634 TaxID=3155813 RepID=UPI003435EFEC
MRVAPAVAALVSAVTLAAGTALPAAARTAPHPVRIVKIYYDSPGGDRRTNDSLNAEYITLLNTSRRAVNLKGWKVRDKSGYTYKFGKVVLRAKKRVTLRTGQGDDGVAVVYWNRKQYVWNNDEDTAYLLDRKGRQVDSCSYKASSRSAYVDC